MKSEIRDRAVTTQYIRVSVWFSFIEPNNPIINMINVVYRFENSETVSFRVEQFYTKTFQKSFNTVYKLKTIWRNAYILKNVIWTKTVSKVLHWMTALFEMISLY